jgi:hypothetical protein
MRNTCTSVTVCNGVRRKIEKDPKDPVLIQTVRSEPTYSPRRLRWNEFPPAAASPADQRGQLAGTLFLGLALSQLMAAVLYVELLPKWQRVLWPDGAVARIEMVVRLLEFVEPAQRPRFARLWSDENFELSP